MKTDRFAMTLMLAAVMTMGLVVGLNLHRGGTPAYAQLAGHSGANYVVEEIQSVDEKDDRRVYNGRTLAVVTPTGTLQLVRITWDRQRGDDEDFPQNYAEAGKTYKIEILEASAQLQN